MKRPAIRWHGGKWRLAPWVIPQMPAHTVYVEPFAGAASVLLQKPRAKFEVYNDIDGAVVNLFRVLRDPAQAAELAHLVRLTPFSRAVFEESYYGDREQPGVDGAHRLLVRSAMGFGSDGGTRTARTGFRAKSGANGSAAMTWARWPADIAEYVERLRGVLIENRPALAVIRQYDTPRTLFYVDPPYVLSTRSSMNHTNRRGHGYQSELTDDDHRELADVLRACRGGVMVSGYRSALYDELYAGWHVQRRPSKIDTGATRTECLWINRSPTETQGGLYAVR